MADEERGTLFPASQLVQGQAQSRRAYVELLDRLRNFAWWQDFEEMLTAGWDWRKAVYLAWAASPAHGRDPETQAQLATGVLGLKSDRVIRTWRERHPEMELTIAALQAAPLLRHRRDIYEALAQSASVADPKHNSDRKLALELLGDYQPRGTVDLTTRTTGVTLDEWQTAVVQRRGQVDATLADFDEAEDEDADET
jgi:hypothetical protein